MVNYKWLTVSILFCACLDSNDSASSDTSSAKRGSTPKNVAPTSDAASLSSDRTDPDLDPLEEAVYAAVLSRRFDSPQYVIEDTTSLGYSAFDTKADQVKNAVSGMQGVSSDIVASFLARNDTGYTLTSRMELGAPYVLLSREAEYRLFSEDGGINNGWQAFYAKYPDAQGIHELSRVGFNASRNQALVYVGFTSASLGGEGKYYLLKKADSKWIIDKEVQTWIS
jgi:hypothetical protein